MQVLNKVAAMCKASKEGLASDELTKDDTEVMWNEFLRFRQQIKYNLMGAILCCCTRKQRDKADTELYKQLLLKSSEIKLTKALDVRSILRTNKYLKLLIHSVLSKQGRFLIRNQHSQLLRIQSQIFTDSEENEELTLSEPDNDIGENLDLLEDFAPRDRAERTLLKGLLQKPKEISNLAASEKQHVSSLASLQDSKEKDKKSGKKEKQRSLSKKKTRLIKRS